jgi:hypothetical protein
MVVLKQSILFAKACTLNWLLQARFIGLPFQIFKGQPIMPEFQIEYHA